MKIGIYGYGNLGRGVEKAAEAAKDAEIVGIFTRRAPESVKTETGAKVIAAADVMNYKDEIDVLVICGGSASDLPEMTPMLAGSFNVVDSFDTHANIPAHFDRVDEAAKKGGKTALISAGWDPGLFSLARAYASAVLPDGQDYTFWGRGVSQGHSDAIRRIPGVKDARQYTVPKQEALDAVRAGQMPTLTTRDKHRRECYVVAEEGADRAEIERQIKEMPNYFADYDTDVTFVSEETLRAEHSALPHGGFVIRTGRTAGGTHTVEYRLALDSNPEFTGSALLAFARAVDRNAKRGRTGCVTVFDLAPADLSPLSPEELRKKLL